MRLIQFTKDGDTTAVGVETQSGIHDTGYRDMLTFIEDGERALDAARSAAERTATVTPTKLLAPLTNPRAIFGSGPNYLSHGQEDPDWEPADEPQWDFIKLSSAITGPFDPIVIPPNDDVIIRRPGGKHRLDEFGFAVDYEVELAVVMGKTAKNLSRDEAADHIFGYTIINDVGARSVQFYFNQRDLAKNFDTFCPMGPCIVTADELADITQMRVEAHVNGELRQSALISDQIALPEVSIEWISSVITLRPGDILSTGTPAGCGTFMDPPNFIEPGDLVRCSATGIGYIENPVVQGTARTSRR